MVVVPRAAAPQVIAEGSAQIARERTMLAEIAAGRSTVELLGLPSS